MFANSCKQASGGYEQGIVETDEITITVKGDEGVEVNKLNTIKIKKSLNLKWKDIKRSAEASLTLKQNKKVKEWRIKDEKGEVIAESRVFEKDEIVFVVTESKEEPTQPFTITIEADEGYTFKESKKPCTIELQKATTWANLKSKAEEKIELVDNYEKTGWKLGGKDGSYLEESYTFNANATIYATSKKKGEPETPKITITVKGDEGFEVSSSNTINADKGSKWESIKTQAQEKVKIKEDFDFVAWHLSDKDGELLLNEKEFKENTVVFAVSKRKVVEYKVEHLRENIENAEYTVYETETKTGEAGKNTSAQTKQYEGFSCQGLVQAMIKADGSTVVQIKYKRNITSLILDLDGGKTATTLKDGEAGKKLLEGKFEAKVEVKGLEKEGYGFEKWEPELPQSFPSTSSNTIYKAKWNKNNVIITVKGDENINVSSPNTLSVAKGSKWADIKTQVTTIASPKEYFEIKEWRVNDKDGELIGEAKEFKENTTVFAVSNREKIRITVKGD